MPIGLFVGIMLFIGIGVIAIVSKSYLFITLAVVLLIIFTFGSMKIDGWRFGNIRHPFLWK